MNDIKKILKFNCFFALILLIATGLLQAQKKAFTIDDLYRLKGVSAPEISPDGTRLLAAVTEYNLKKGTSNSDIFLLNLADGKLRQLTYNEKSDTSPSWSVDGQTIYFISDREGSEQLWEMNAHGGEARKITDFHTGISSPLQAKGTRNIFFTSSVFPPIVRRN